MPEFQPNTTLINKDLANRSHAFTSFDPERRAEQEISGFAAEVQAKEAKPTSALTFPGGQIVDNAEFDRVQIIHVEKPAQEVIDKLKAEGWRWSPAGRCWQRKRTEAAMQSAKQIMGVI